MTAFLGVGIEVKTFSSVAVTVGDMKRPVHGPSIADGRLTPPHYGYNVFGTWGLRTW